MEVSNEVREYLVKHEVHDLMDDMAALLLDEKPEDVEGFLASWLEKDGMKKELPLPPCPAPMAQESAAPPAPYNPLEPIQLREENGVIEQYCALKKEYLYIVDGKAQKDRPAEMEAGGKPVLVKKHQDWRVKWDYKKHKVFYSNTVSKVTTWKIAETPFA